MAMFATRKVIALTRLNKIYRQNESSNVNEIKPDGPGHCQKRILIHRVALDFPLRLRNKVHFISRIDDAIHRTVDFRIDFPFEYKKKNVYVISKKRISSLNWLSLYRVANFSYAFVKFDREY